MKFSFCLLTLAVALVSAQKWRKPSFSGSALTSLNSSNKTVQEQPFGLLSPAVRAPQTLESFIITSIQTSKTLSQAEQQSLLSDYFSLANRNKVMGGSLKDFFGIAPAPGPAPEPALETCSSTNLETFNEYFTASENYPDNYPSDKDIHCAYVFQRKATARITYINISGSPFVLDPQLASLTIYEGPPTSLQKLQDISEKLVSSTAEVITVVFKSKANAVGKWKFKVQSFN